MRICDFENPSELPISRAEVVDMVNSDPTLLLGNNDMISWSSGGNTESHNYWHFDEKLGILYSENTNGAELHKLVEIAEKLRANLIGEDNAIFLPNGDILDEAWKGESLWQSFRRWLKGLPRSTELKPVFRWDK